MLIIGVGDQNLLTGIDVVFTRPTHPYFFLGLGEDKPNLHCWTWISPKKVHVHCFDPQFLVDL